MAFHIPDNNHFEDMTPKSWEFLYSVRDAFTKLVKMDGEPKVFREKIRLISQPFWEAYLKGKHAMVNIFDKEEIEETGTFITQCPSMTHTYFYYIKTMGHGDDWKMDWTLLLFTKRSGADTAGLDLCLSEMGDKSKSFIWKEWEDAGMTKGYWMAWLISLIAFIKYCPMETKIVNAGRKDYHVGEKYLNETRHNIEILDSTWFTTIIRSEGFEVGGHFRLQPWGPGMSQRRLQWIEPFQKHGYTRKAKIL